MLKLPKLNLKRPHFTDEFKQELGLIGFFCLFGVGLYLINISLCFIICGLMGIFFFYPRGDR